jgi:hypothetical protein
MIWELFGRDPSGIPWRVCPHCQRIFTHLELIGFTAHLDNRSWLLNVRMRSAYVMRKRAKNNEPLQARPDVVIQIQVRRSDYSRVGQDLI